LCDKNEKKKLSGLGEDLFQKKTLEYAPDLNIRIFLSH